MNENEIRNRFPNASPGFIRANLCPESSRKVAKLESDCGDAPLEPEEIQRPIGKRILVRITSVRRRLLDEDNQCEKYHVDLCRYAGIISCDSPDKVKIEVRQRKASKKEAEQITIEIF